MCERNLLCKDICPLSKKGDIYFGTKIFGEKERTRTVPVGENILEIAVTSPDLYHGEIIKSTQSAEDIIVKGVDLPLGSTACPDMVNSYLATRDKVTQSVSGRIECRYTDRVILISTVLKKP